VTTSSRRLWLQQRCLGFHYSTIAKRGRGGGEEEEEERRRRRGRGEEEKRRRGGFSGEL